METEEKEETNSQEYEVTLAFNIAEYEEDDLKLFYTVVTLTDIPEDLSDEDAQTAIASEIAKNTFNNGTLKCYARDNNKRCYLTVFNTKNIESITVIKVQKIEE